MSNDVLAFTTNYPIKSTYVPTTDDVETAFHEFASWLESTSPGEYAEAPEFADWQEAMHGFRRWLERVKAEAQVKALRGFRRELIEHQLESYGVILPDVHEVLDDLADCADRIARAAGIDSKGESND